MFIAKFKQTDSELFKVDINSNKPFIGTLIAGTAKGTIINGTIFTREGLQENKAYLCHNVYSEYEGKQVLNTEVITEVNTLELQPLMSQLGKPFLDRPTTASQDEAAE